MKKFLYLFVLIALLIPATAFASGGKPPQPTCDEGQITVEESVWTDGHFVCPEGYEYVGMGFCKMGHDYVRGKYVPGAWSDPVCRDPIPGCMDETAFNFNPDAEVDDDSCVYDVCPNLEGLQEEIPEGYIKPGRRCIPKPFNLKEVTVGVSAFCGKSVDGLVYQLQGGVGISPAGGATLTIDGVDYTASSPWWGSFGTHTWSAVATEGYVIVNASEGSFEIEKSDCNDDPEVPPTGAEMLVGPAIAGLAGISMLGVGAYLLRKEREN